MVESPVEETQEPEEDNPFNKFSPRLRRAVEGLVHLGELKRAFDYCGHRFVLRTLTAGEELSAAAAISDYRETLKEAEAFAAAQVGLALVAIDRKEDFCPPIGPDEESFARARFQYVTKNWYWPVIAYLYEQLVLLQGEQIEAIDAIRDLSRRSPHISPPFADFSTEQGNLEEPIDSETPRSIPSSFNS